MFCLIALRGFPSICNLTRLLIKPISEGKSGRSLLDRSKVLSCLTLMMFWEIFLILLSFKIRTVRFGHRSKSSNSVNLLKERARISNFSDHGTSVKEVNRFSFNSSTIMLLVWEKDPFSILSILFLFKVRVSSLEQSLNVAAVSSLIKFPEASTLLSPSPNRGRALSLLSLIIKCSRVLMPERLGRVVIPFSDKISSTKAGQKDSSFEIVVSLFLERSRDFKVWNLKTNPGKMFT